jgi:two-component system, sensor histidine kinase and response regulator
LNNLEYRQDGQAHFEKHPPHILVVDDQLPNRNLLTRILHKEYKVTEAEDGLSALALIEEQQFELIILDIMMPGMPGFEVLTTIREHASSTELPVILVSALHENDDIVHGLKLGANDYITKPIDVNIVRARVMTQLQLKQAFDIQKQAYIDLKKADVLKNQLLSIASHDLKSPISSLYMGEVLLRDLTDPNDETINTILDTIKQTLSHMNDIVVDFLDMGAIHSGIIDVKLEPVDVTGIIDDIIYEFQLHAEEKGSQITVRHCEGIVTADHRRLMQVLSNLVSNALKYSPPNSQITLNTVDDEDHIVIEVIDQGPGIPENEKDLLFTEFGKLSPRPTAQESSTGLGLWIVKKMVEAMNGEVDVNCPDDGGSIFWVRLPKA